MYFHDSVNRHIKLEAHDLAERILREFRPADFQYCDLLVRHRFAVERIHVRLEIRFDVRDAVRFEILLVGIDFHNDRIAHCSGSALTTQAQLQESSAALLQILRGSFSSRARSDLQPSPTQAFTRSFRASLQASSLQSWLHSQQRLRARKSKQSMPRLQISLLMTDL